DGSIDERMAAIEDRKTGAMTEFFKAFAAEEELKRLRRQAQIDEATEMAAAMLAEEAEGFDAQAAELEERARDLRAQAAGVDRPSEMFTRLDPQADAAREREKALWRAREDAIVSVKPQSEIARIDDHRARVRSELERLDAEREALVEQSRRAA